MAGDPSSERKGFGGGGGWVVGWFGRVVVGEGRWGWGVAGGGLLGRGEVAGEGRGVGGGAQHTLAVAIGLGLAMSTSRFISLATSCYLFCLTMNTYIFMCWCTCGMYIVHQRTVMLIAAGSNRLITDHCLYWTSAQAQRNYLGQFQSPILLCKHCRVCSKYLFNSHDKEVGACPVQYDCVVLRLAGYGHVCIIAIPSVHQLAQAVIDLDNCVDGSSKAIVKTMASLYIIATGCYQSPFVGVHSVHVGQHMDVYS